ncbi:MAG: undecaprenyl-diphosphate phosphatase [Verrucomicrobiales bacterium]|nr:undecaprenyl-diphosphate phosphatase [Verrucomicrobiales bacterium]
MSSLPDWLAVIILGIIEGVTEFLPISSTGHLLIPQNLGWLPKQGEVFDVVIQSGAVIAVLAVFTNRVKQFATSLNQPDTRDYLLKLFGAFCVTSAGGLLIKKFDIELPETVPPVAWATFIGAFVIFAVEAWRKDHRGTAEITWTVVVAVGLAQLLAAVFPGTSRSGASILMAMALGMARPAATEFSFLLGVPTLMAAGAFKILSAFKDGEAAHLDWAMLGLGTVVSAISAFVVVRWLIHFVQSHTFNGFAWYRLLMGGALLAYVYWGQAPAAP